jgi:putative transcriptional regulator
MKTARPAALLLCLLLGLAPSIAAQPADGSRQFLVADRDLTDPNFERSVVLLVQHGAEGSWGLVINRPTGVPLAKLFAEEPHLGRQEGILFTGGPVGAGRFLLLLRARRRPEASQPVFADVYLGWTPAVLRDPRGISEFRVYSGYAGWAPGQLEAEIARGDWHLLPAEVPLVFEQRSERVWEELTRRVETTVAAGRQSHVMEEPL